jgi:hypothetical protein
MGARSPALMAAGSGAFLSHGTAAWRWQITPAPPTVIELSVPHRRAAADGIALHRRGVLRRGDVTWNGRFRSTSVARTLLDLGVRYEQPALLRALAEAEFQHDLRPADILRVLRRGHPGSANLRAALDAHTPGHGQAKSRLERRFRALLIRHDVELPERNRPVGPWVVDCVWPARRVVVELDGRQHARPHQADTDDDRDLWMRRNRRVPRRYGNQAGRRAARCGDRRPPRRVRRGSQARTPRHRPAAVGAPQHTTTGAAPPPPKRRHHNPRGESQRQCG